MSKYDFVLGSVQVLHQRVLGVKGLSQNADTADALEGGGGRSKPKWWHDDMLGENMM